MNKIFKVIWSKSRNCYVVASELAKGTSKSTSTGRMAKRAALAAVAALLLFPAGIGNSYAKIDSATINGTSVITGTQDDAAKISGTVMKATNNAKDIGNLQTAMQNVETELAQHQSVIDNLGTDKLTLSSDNTLQKESYDSTTKTTTKTDVTGLKVAGSISAESASISGTLSAGGAVNAGSVNSRGNITAAGTIAGKTVTATGTIKGKDLIGSNSIISQGTIAATGNISSQATVGAKEMVSQTNITAQDQVVGMQGVIDNTLTSGTYVTAGDTVGKNIVALDTQVKANADAIAKEARKRKYSVTNLENADKQLQTNIDNEAAAREAADTALDTRITNVKEYLQQEAADTYVSKDDAAVQDGAIVKAANTIGENVTNLDAALAKETAARIGADAAQDKVIQQVNQNMVDGFNTINKNMADGFTALNQADAKEAQERAAADTVLDNKITAETSARVTADTKLAEAVNGGLSLSNDNVLQKNTTTIDAQGNVTPSKTYANEMILNKSKDNQITLNENGIKVGTNSSVMDKDGVYTGGDTYSEAKAAMSADGKIKGANGAFTVDENGNVISKATITGETVTDGKGASMSNGTVTGKTLTDGIATISNGNIKTNGGFIQTGGGNVNTQGGEVRTNGGKVATSGGEINTGSGAIKTVGGDIAAGTGNISGQNITASGVLSGDSLTVAKGMTGHSLTLTGGDLDAGAGTIKTTGKVEAGTLTTTGDATIGGNLTVDKNLTVNGEFNANTLSSKLDENNYTKIHGGNVTSVNSKVDTTDGKIYTSTSTLTEKGKTETASNGINRNVNKMDATESSNVITNDANGQTSTFNQRVDEILNQINSSDTVFSKVDQKVDNITSEVKNGDKSTSTTQSATDITNTAKQGTITNDAQKLVNKASDTISNEAANDITNTSTNGNISNTANNGTISNTAKNIENTASENITNTAKNGSITNDAKNIVNKASETLSNEAKNITNTATEDMTNTIGRNLTTTVGGDMSTEVTGNQSNTVKGTLTETVTGKVTEDYKSDLDTKIGGNEIHAVTGNQTVTVSKDRTVNVKGTETENFNAQVTSIKTDQKTSVGGNQTNIVAGNQQNTVSGSKTETVKGSVTEKYGSQATTVDGDQSTNVGGNQSNVVAGNQTNTISGNKTETVKGAVSETYGSQTTKVNGDQSTTVTGKQTNSITGDQVNTIGGSQTTMVTGDVTEDYKANLSTTVGGNQTTTVTGKQTNSITGDQVNTIGGSQTTTVTGDSTLSAKNITNTAKGGTIYNQSKDILNEATGDILNFADGEIGNVATKITNITGDTTVTSDTNGTTFENTAHNTALTEMTKHESGDFTKTTISGNTLTTGQATMDYAEVMKDLGVHGNATVDGDTSVGGNLSVTGTSTLTGDVTMKSNATVEKDLTVKGTTTTDKLVVNNGATVTGGTTTDTLNVTGESTFGGKATFKDIVTMEKDLSVGGNATVAGSMTASSYKVGYKTYIDSTGINANNQKIVNVAAGDLSASSTDAVNGAQLYQTNERVASVENRVDTVENRVSNLDSRVDKVGANAAALANLHPLEFDADSKWNIAAAVGGYKGETATAIGAFYRPNENVMVNVSSSFGTGENMYGGGISLRIGQGGNKARRNATNGLTDREKAMQKQIDSLTNRLDALLSVINPNMSKDFPDVPENHWAYEAVSKLAGNGIIQGYEDGKYHGERTMTRYEMAEIIYNALSKGAKAEKKLVEEFKPELQAMAAQKKA